MISSDSKTTISMAKKTKEKLQDFKSGTWDMTLKTFIEYFDLNGYDDLLDIKYEIKNKKSNGGEEDGEKE